MTERYWGYCIKDCGWEIEGNNKDEVYEHCHVHAMTDHTKESHMVRLFLDGEKGTHQYFLSYDREGVGYDKEKTYKECVEERGAENV